MIGIATAGGDSAWYQALSKPSWTPPSAVFAPVWTMLYAMMGVAAWLVWRRGGWSVQRWRLRLFLVQLILNFAWSFLFFSLHRVGWALVDIVLLWVAIVATIGAFWGADRRAAWLLAPYLVWVSFATALNLEIYRLQPATVRVPAQAPAATRDLYQLEGSRAHQASDRGFPAAARRGRSESGKTHHE